MKTFATILACTIVMGLPVAEAHGIGHRLHHAKRAVHAPVRRGGSSGYDGSYNPWGYTNGSRPVYRQGDWIPPVPSNGIICPPGQFCQ